MCVADGSGYEEVTNVAQPRSRPLLSVIVWGPRRNASESEGLVLETLDLLRPLATSVLVADEESVSSLAGILRDVPARAAQVVALGWDFFEAEVALRTPLIPCDVLGAATRSTVPDGEVFFPWGTLGHGFAGCLVAAAETGRVLGDLLQRSSQARAPAQYFEGWLRHVCTPRLRVADYDLWCRLPVDGAFAVLFADGVPACPLAWGAFFEWTSELLWEALAWGNGYPCAGARFWSERVLAPENEGCEHRSLLRRALDNPRLSHFVFAPSDSAPLWDFSTFAGALNSGESCFDASERELCCCLSRRHAVELLAGGSAPDAWYGTLVQRHGHGAVRRRSIAARLPELPRFLLPSRLEQLATEGFLVAGVRGNCPVAEGRDAALDVHLAGSCYTPCRSEGEPTQLPRRRARRT
jgi:hypothetical protein